MNWRKILIGVLLFATVVEFLFPLGGFLMPERVLELFKVGSSPDTLFMAFVASWLLLFVALVCALTVWLVKQNVRAGWYLSFTLGYWWVGIGVGLAVVYQRYDNLVLDALKGLIIAVSAHKSLPAA